MLGSTGCWSTKMGLSVVICHKTQDFRAVPFFSMSNPFPEQRIHAELPWNFDWHTSALCSRQSEAPGQRLENLAYTCKEWAILACEYGGNFMPHRLMCSQIMKYHEISISVWPPVGLTFDRFSLWDSPQLRCLIILPRNSTNESGMSPKIPRYSTIFHHFQRLTSKYLRLFDPFRIQGPLWIQIIQIQAPPSHTGGGSPPRYWAPMDLATPGRWSRGWWGSRNSSGRRRSRTPPGWNPDPRAKHGQTR